MFEQFGNVMDMVKKMQQNIEGLQTQLKDVRVEAASGDVIKVTANGQQDLISIELNSNYLSPENLSLLQDLLVTTVNNVLAKSRELNQTAMNKLYADLNLPKIPGLF